MTAIKLPITEKLVLDSNENQWQLLANELIPQLLTSAIIKISPDRSIKIKIVLQKALPPENLDSTGDVLYHKGDLGEDIDIGFARIKKFLWDFFDREMWLLIGYIDGQNKIPVIITHYPSFGSIYTQRINNEKSRLFPSLN